MRRLKIVLYVKDENSVNQSGDYDRYGITKIFEQMFSEFDYSSKIQTDYLFVKYQTLPPGASSSLLMSQAEKDYLSVFNLPFLAFYDPDAARFYGIIEQKDFKYNALKSSMDVIANTKNFDEQKGYQVQIGNTTYFYRDARNAHLSTGGTDINPKHSLLDAVYLGANLGIFDRPYLRDMYTQFLDGLKKYWWILPVAIGGVVVYKNRQQKRRNTRYVKYIKGVRKNKRKSTPSVKRRKKAKK